MGIKKWVNKAFSWLAGVETKPSQLVEVNRRNSVAPITIPFGLNLIENGQVVYEKTHGSDRRYLTQVIVLGEGPVEEIGTIKIDGKPLSDFKRVVVMDENSGSWVGDDSIVIQKFTGRAGQPQSTLANDANAEWGAKARTGPGICYVVVRYKGVADFFQGKPNFAAEVKGLKLQDPRSGQTVYSANAALAIREAMRNTTWGRSIPETELGEEFENAADDCDQGTNVAAMTSLGTPDEILDYAGTKSLVWYTKPANANASTQQTIRNASGTKTATAGVMYTSPGFNGYEARTFLWFTMTSGADFTTADEIFVGAESSKLLEANILLNAGTERDTAFKALQTLLPAARGMLPRTKDKYELYVEGPRTPVFQITEEHLHESGYSITMPKKKDRVNQVQAKFRNPNKNWKEDVVTYPEPGSAEDLALLAADNGVRMTREVSFPHCADVYSCTDLAKIFLYRTRDNIETDFDGTMRLMDLTVGDVVGLTLGGPGWNGKTFLVQATSISRTGATSLDLVEFESAIYTYDQIPLDLLSDNTDLGDPFYADPPTNGSIVSIFDLDPTGSKIYLDVDFDGIDDVDLEEYELQYKIDTDSTWTSVFARESRFKLDGILWLRTYQIRIRSLKRLATSDWLVLPDYPVLTDTTPPSAPSITELQSGDRRLTVTIDKPPEEDFAFFRVYVNTTNTIPGSAYIVEAYGDQHEIPNLLPETDYWVWATAVDDLGNESVPSTVATAATLGSSTDVRIYKQETQPGTASAGDLWIIPSTGATQEYNGSNWVAHIPPDPTGIVLLNPVEGVDTDFDDIELIVGWDPAPLDIYLFEVEVRWNNRLQRSSTIEPRGGVASATYRYSYEDAIADDPENGGGEDYIKDGARNVQISVFMLNPDEVTRSQSATSIQVVNRQLPAPVNPTFTQNGYSAVLGYDKPQSNEFQGIVVHRSDTPGFVPGVATAFGYFDDPGNSINIGPLLDESKTHYVVFAFYDVWGRDGVSYSPEFAITMPDSTYNDTYLMATAPVDGVDGTLKEGDLWIRSSDNNQFRYDGAIWEDVQDNGIVTALIDASNAQDTADTKVRTFVSDTAPTPDGVGDLWIKSNSNNQLFRWDGGLWVDVRDDEIQVALDTANSKITTFTQATTPTALAIGDLWIDTSWGGFGRLRRWNGVQWAFESGELAGLSSVDTPQVESGAISEIDGFTSAQIVGDGTEQLVFTVGVIMPDAGDLTVAVNYAHNYQASENWGFRTTIDGVNIANRPGPPGMPEPQFQASMMRTTPVAAGQRIVRVYWYGELSTINCKLDLTVIGIVR